MLPTYAPMPTLILAALRMWSGSVQNFVIFFQLMVGKFIWGVFLAVIKVLGSGVLSSGSLVIHLL